MSQVSKPEKKEEKPVEGDKPKKNPQNKRKNSTEDRKRKFREWKKTLVVTLDTPIDELPKKGDRLVAPSRAEHDKELERIEAEIQRTLKEYV